MWVFGGGVRATGAALTSHAGQGGQLPAPPTSPPWPLCCGPTLSLGADTPLGEAELCAKAIQDPPQMADAQQATAHPLQHACPLPAPPPSTPPHPPTICACRHARRPHAAAAGADAEQVVVERCPITTGGGGGPIATGCCCCCTGGRGDCPGAAGSQLALRTCCCCRLAGRWRRWCQACGERRRCCRAPRGRAGAPACAPSFKRQHVTLEVRMRVPDGSHSSW